MTIKFEYTPLMIAKMERRIGESYAEFPVEPRPNGKGDFNNQKRHDHFLDRVGLTIGYCKNCGPDKTNREPSGRVLKNLGFEVWLKDVETGEMEKVEYFGRCEIDHSQPTNPRFIRD